MFFASSSSSSSSSSKSNSEVKKTPIKSDIFNIPKPLKILFAENEGDKVKECDTDYVVKKIGAEEWCTTEVLSDVQFDSKIHEPMFLGSSPRVMTEELRNRIRQEIMENSKKASLRRMEKELGYGPYAQELIKKGQHIYMYSGPVREADVESNKQGYDKALFKDKKTGTRYCISQSKHRNHMGMMPDAPMKEYLKHCHFDDSVDQTDIATLNVGEILYYFKEKSGQEHLVIVGIALRDINANEPLCTSYGSEYWKYINKTPCLFTKQGKIIAYDEDKALVKTFIQGKEYTVLISTWVLELIWQEREIWEGLVRRQLQESEKELVKWLCEAEIPAGVFECIVEIKKSPFHVMVIFNEKIGVSSNENNLQIMVRCMLAPEQMIMVANYLKYVFGEDFRKNVDKIKNAKWEMTEGQNGKEAIMLRGLLTPGDEKGAPSTKSYEERLKVQGLNNPVRFEPLEKKKHYYRLVIDDLVALGEPAMKWMRKEKTQKEITRVVECLPSSVVEVVADYLYSTSPRLSI